MKLNFSYFCLPLALFWGSIKIANAQVDSTIYKNIVKTIDTAKPKSAPGNRTLLLELALVDVANNRYVIQTTENDAISCLQTAVKNYNIQDRLPPDRSVEQKRYGVVILSVANLRTKPGHVEEMATQVLLGKIGRAHV